MKRLLCLIPVLLFVCYSYAQERNYNISFIDTSLLNNADAVKRVDEIKIIIKDIGRAVVIHKYAITILNTRGDKHAPFYERYDKFTEIGKVEGQLFDAGGKRIKTMKKNDLEDISTYNDANLEDDARIKAHKFTPGFYPYTVEYECEINMNGIFYFPSWQPVDAYQLAVQNSSLTIVTPPDYLFRYKSFNYKDAPVITTNAEEKKYQWSISSYRAIEKEDYSPLLQEITPTILLAPVNFEIDKYKGNMSSWNELGKFIYQLNKGRDQLPDNVKRDIHQIADNLKDTVEKIKVLYKYLQAHTRYVSIQLGIGGWQPFDANYVATKGYGDCKALSNYMYAILKEAGIRSNYALIKSGKFKTYFNADFPSTQFDHIIVAVPYSKDTMWLECTDQTLPAGYLSAFTAERNALLIDENGGKLVRTPKYGLKENIQSRKINAQLNTEGNLSLHINTRYKAIQQDYLQGMIHALSKSKVMEYLKEEIELPSYDVMKFDYREDNEIIPSIYEELELTAYNYAQVSGKRIFFNPNILARNDRKFKKEAERINDINIVYEFQDVDTVEINIPEGYQLENNFTETNINSKFGKYSIKLTMLDNKLVYCRHFEQFSGRFPAKEYSGLVDFYEKVSKADKAKVVLRKKE